MLISQSTAQRVLQAALETGADFSEIFVEKKRVNGILMISGAVETVQSGFDSGLGLRIIYGTQSLYGYTSDLREESLIKMARTLAAAIRRPNQNNALSFSNSSDLAASHQILIPPSGIAMKKRIEKMREADGFARAYDSLISQVSIRYADSAQEVLIANSQGKWVEDQRTRTRFSVSSVAEYQGEMQTGGFSPGAAQGFEFVEGLDVKALAEESARVAVTMAKADPCPAGSFPVIIDNGFGGVIFHEACGHGLEATSVAKNNSIFSNRLGQTIASKKVTAIDDGTIPNAWGSSTYDDEGALQRKRILIEEGVLKSYMIDELNGKRMNMASTGSARRESYKYAPTSRMSNTYIAAGNDSVQEIFSATKNGLYAKYMGGGSVNPITGEFNFSVMEGYLVKNGKIERPVRGATLIGKGSDVLTKIDYVADNLEHGQGMCGSSSGSIPANVGQPMIRVSNMTVGGRKEEEK